MKHCCKLKHLGFKNVPTQVLISPTTRDQHCRALSNCKGGTLKKEGITLIYKPKKTRGIFEVYDTTAIVAISEFSIGQE